MKKRTAVKRSTPPAKQPKSPAAKPDPTAYSSGESAIGTFNGDKSVAERHAAGRDLRAKVPREAHGGWTRPADHPGGVDIVLSGNKGRQQDLVPLRMARMCASPFAFFRGAASVMASDLAKTPISGIYTVIDGDAHLNNFGLYGTPQRDVV